VAGDSRRGRRERNARVTDAGTGDRYESGTSCSEGRCAVPGANSGGKERAKSGANVTDARTPWRMRAFCPAVPLLRPGGRASPPGRRQGGRVAGRMCGERRSWRRSEGGAGEHCARAERSGARARLGRCVWEGHLSGRRAVAAPPTPLRRRRGKGGPRAGATAFECEQLGRSPRGPTLRFYEKRTKGVTLTTKLPKIRKCSIYDLARTTGPFTHQARSRRIAFPGAALRGLGHRLGSWEREIFSNTKQL
jgi:hypothetical protein